MYDLDNDGFISESELLNVMQQSVGHDMNTTQLKQIVAKTLEEADHDKDHKLSF